VQLVSSTDGVQVAVHDFGGDGPPVVFSHATGLLGMLYQPLAHELGGYHGFAIDYRGHGDATAPANGRFDWNGMRDDALAVLDALDLRDLYGFGHSMGGAVLLMTELVRPGTFRALALYEPIVFPPDRPQMDGPAPIVVGARRRRPEFPSRDAAYENFSNKPPLNVLAPEVLRLYVDHGFKDTPAGTVRLKCEPESEARTFEANMSFDTYSHLPDVTCPVLVMAEPPQDLTPSMSAEETAARLPRGRYHRFDQLDHFGPLEDPAAVAAVVADFFASTTN
jgi:pimeloyl-ACP methyl ester carboxylesterase